MDSSTRNGSGISTTERRMFIESVREELRSTTHTNQPSNNHQFPSIFMVPRHLRREDVTAYEPKTVSIGPYHRDKRFRATEQLKWRYLHQFLAEAPLEDLLTSMMRKEQAVRQCYSEPIDMNSYDLARMLLLDACFILGHVCKFHESHPTNVNNIIADTPWALPYVTLDLMLLENQIPFFIIHEIYHSIEAVVPDIIRENSGTHLIGMMVSYFRKHTEMILELKPGAVEPYHLLHLVHTRILPRRRCPGRDSKDKKGEPDISREWIPSATQLHNAGIKFRANENYGPLEVTFKEGVIQGVIEMSQLKVYDDTVPLLRNLVAFEQCNSRFGMDVTCYASFVDKLVDRQGDVAILLRERVMVNGMGSEEGVALLFNQLCKNVVVTKEKSYLLGLYLDLNRHCNKRLPRWRARLVRDYLGSPWAVISVLAALILLLLTVVQTIFNVIGYAKPPLPSS